MMDAALILLAYVALSALNAFVLRHRLAFCQRLNDVNWQAWANIDAMVAYAIFGLLYLAGRFPYCPRLGETISSITGRALMANRRWARIVAPPIDALFLTLFSQRHHCLATFDSWRDPMKNRKA